MNTNTYSFSRLFNLAISSLALLTIEAHAHNFPIGNPTEPKGKIVNQVPTINSGGTTVFCSGGSLLLTSSLADSYQWYKDGVLISEATEQTYSVTTNGVYRVAVNYGEGSSGTSAGLLIRQGNRWTGATDGDWDNPTNWSCGAVPLATDHIIIDGATGTEAVISDESQMEINSLSVAGSATLIVESGNTLKVTNAISVDANASLIIRDEASLVQTNNANNTGNIIAEKKTSPMKRYDFTYWSAPVSGQTLYNLSPNTLADKYYSFSPVIGNWVSHLNGAQVMEKGKGYIVRAPQSFSADDATTYEAAFIGNPTNGIVETPIIIGNSDMNLIGNPYPSAIDMDLFLTNPTNVALTDGTIYLWTHNSGPAASGSSFNYTSNDYAAYNLLGGTATSTSGNNETPTGKVASGQCFFIQGIANGQAIFDNSMRVSFSNDQFFRSANTIEKHRIWLNMSSEEGAFKQTLVGYVTGATNEIDRNFDGIDFNGNSFVDLYTISDDKHFTIQGRALPFDEQATIPLGYSTTIAGTFSIGLAQFDGLFSAQQIYVYDYVSGTLHDLKTGDYTFSTESGTYNTRFELRFVDSALQTQNFTADHIMIAAGNSKLEIEAATIIESVTVMDLSGRKIYEQNAINATSFMASDFNLNNTTVLIVKIKLGNGNSFAKKIIMN